MSIQKIIHYCWFGKGQKSELNYKCIESWKKYCPHYQINEWNEDNVDISENKFVKDMYENRRWAFVSDYFRMKQLNEFGGIYFDTDVEIFRSFDALLSNSFFAAFRNTDMVNMAVLGAEKGSCYTEDWLVYYNEYCLQNASRYDLANGWFGTYLLHNKYGLKFNGKEQLLQNGISIYEPFVFHIREDGLENLNYSVHHSEKTWITQKYSSVNNNVADSELSHLLVLMDKALRYKKMFNMMNFSVYLFGAGTYTYLILSYLGLLGINVQGIIVNDDIYKSDDLNYKGFQVIRKESWGTLKGDDTLIIPPPFEYITHKDHFSFYSSCRVMRFEDFLNKSITKKL